MKLLRTLVLGLFILSGFVVNAQTVEEVAANKTQEMIELLDLNEQQIERVKILNLKVTSKIDVIQNDATMSPEKKEEFIAGNHGDESRTLQAILTPAQFQIWEAEMAP
jgi:hypothetical protein